MSISSRDVYDVMVVGAWMIGSAAARYASANQALRVCVVGPAEPSQVSLHVMCKMSAMRVLYMYMYVLRMWLLSAMIYFGL